jgi:predicted RNA-binding protein Jag
MPYDNCAPLPKWARILKDFNLFYFVPNFSNLLIGQQGKRGSPEEALAWALYMAQPNFNTGNNITNDVNKFKEAFQGWNLETLTYVAHRIVARASRRHREKMLDELAMLKELPFSVRNMY